MNEPQPDSPGVRPDLLLVRRIAPRAVEGNTGRIKAIAFNLRPARGERELSFYDAAHVDRADLLQGAPSAGWLVASIEAGTLTELGFELRFEEDEADERIGKHHVSARPPAYDSEGQIPLEIRGAVSAAATVLDAEIRSDEGH